MQLPHAPSVFPRAAARRVLIATMLAPLLLLARSPSAHAQVYFTAFFGSGGTGIERAGFDGAGMQTLQFQPIGFADGLALDVGAGKMYWTDTAEGSIWRSNLNGSEAEIVVIDSGLEPNGIALDVRGGKIYWTDNDGVKVSNLDGTEEELLTAEHARGFIALDLNRRKIYWADWKSGTILAAPISKAPLSVTTILKGQACPFGIAVDEATGELYWLGLEEHEKLKCAHGSAIARANPGESEPRAEPLLTRYEAGLEGGLVVDSVAKKLYWSEAEALDIRVSNLDGSEEHMLFSTGEDFPEGLAIEHADPHPLSTAAPSIEGNATVGSYLACNPGNWSGTGAIGLSYQWAVAGAGAIEGATTSLFVPSSELEGAALECVVTASDAVATTTVFSPAVTIGAYPGGTSPPPAPRLQAWIALAHLTSHGTRASIPVITSLAGVATLTATPRARRSVKRTGARRAGRARATVTAARGQRRSRLHARSSLLSTRSLHAGRNVLALSPLHAGTTYSLHLSVESADGQRVTSSATLTVARR